MSLFSKSCMSPPPIHFWLSASLAWHWLFTEINLIFLLLTEIDMIIFSFTGVSWVAGVVICAMGKNQKRPPFLLCKLNLVHLQPNVHPTQVNCLTIPYLYSS